MGKAMKLITTYVLADNEQCLRILYLNLIVAMHTKYKRMIHHSNKYNPAYFKGCVMRKNLIVKGRASK